MRTISTIQHRRSPFVFCLSLSILAGALAGVSYAQTNPVPQSLPYSEDFSGLAHSSTTYPAGWQGWRFGVPSTSYGTLPTGDQPLTPLCTAATATPGIHNYGGKLGYLDGPTDDNGLVLAINATNYQALKITFDYGTVHQVPGANKMSGNLWYRIGSSGSWVATVPFFNLNTSPATGGASIHISNMSIPGSANNQPVVQIRWVDRGLLLADGSTSSWALDNVSVTGTIINPVPTQKTTWGRVKSLYR